MPRFTIETDYLGEFVDPVNYDLEVGGDHPSHHFYADLARQIGGQTLEVACGTGLVAIPLAQHGIPITGMDIVPAFLAHALCISFMALFSDCKVLSTILEISTERHKRYAERFSLKINV